MALSDDRLHVGLIPDGIHVHPQVVAMVQRALGDRLTIVTDAVARAIGDKFSFYSTYGWHPLSVDAALANVRYFIKHQEDLLRHVIEVSAYFEARLSRMKFKFPATIRMRGLAIGVEVDEPGYAAKIQDKALENGLLFSVENDVLKLFPALTVTQETAKEGLDILETCV